MKKTLIFAAAMAVAAVSCQKEKLAIEQTNSIKIAAETMPLTKVNFQDGTGPVWKAGEKASLISMSTNSVYATSALEASNITADGSKAWFAFESVAEGSYRIVSPEPASASADGVVFNVPASQTQDILGLSGSRAYLVGGVKSGESDLADIAVSSETTSYEAIFKLAGALLQFNVYNSSNPTGEKIRSITVTPTNAKLSGNMTVAYDGTLQSSTGTGESVTVMVNKPEIVVATRETAKAVYAAVLPAKIESNDLGSVTYTIVTDRNVYSFVSKGEKNWDNGYIYPVNIDLAYATTHKSSAPIMSSTHPYAEGNFEMTETEPGVYTIKHIWLSGKGEDGKEKDIYFPAGTSGFYYNAVDGCISSEDPEFDLVYSSEPVALKVDDSDVKNYAEKYYTIILNTNTMKLKVLQDRGERFWITGGGSFSWDLYKYEMDVDSQAGKATWSGYLKAGVFKIHGDNLWEGENKWNGPANKNGSGEWYFCDSSRENGISMNSCGDHKWEIAKAGYYALEFDYKSSPMTFSITKKDHLDLTVNKQALTYSGNYQYFIETTFTQGEDFTLAGCKNLEYVHMDPDFLRKEGETYKFNAVTGTYKFILNLQSHDVTWADSEGKNMIASWTLFQGTKDNNGTYSTLILAGEGVARLTVNSQPGWENLTSPVQPYMAEIEDGVFQFTGRYSGSWEWQKPYNRWTWNLNFKYFGNTSWGGGIDGDVNLVDNTGCIKQNPAGSKDSNGNSNEFNLTWKDKGKYWDEGAMYRMTVNMNTTPHTVTFDKVENL